MDWFEEQWLSKKKLQVKKLFRTFCPVCKSYLGERYEGTLFEGHCKECACTFTFTPGANLPTALLDYKRDKACDCSNCKGGDLSHEPDPTEQDEYDGLGPV